MAIQFITFKEADFSSAKDFFLKHSPQEEELLSETDFLQTLTSAESTILPSIYLYDNDFFACGNDFIVQGLMLRIFSFESKILFGFEIYSSPYLRRYDVSKSNFNLLLNIERSKIRKFTFEDKKPIREVKQQLHHAIWASFAGAGQGGYLPRLIASSITNLVSKAENESKESEGTVFTLEFIDDTGNEVAISIACNEHYANSFEVWLEEQWKPTKPEIREEPRTKDERRIRAASRLKVGDKVRVPGWFNQKFGHIIRKEKDYAVINFVEKNGKEYVENVDYLKITKLRW